MKKVIMILLLLSLSGFTFAGISEKNLEVITTQSTAPAGQFCDSDTADECEDWDAAAAPNNKRLTWTDDTEAGTIDHAGTPAGTWACDGTYVLTITHSADTAGDAYTYHQLATAWTGTDTDYWLELQIKFTTMGALASAGSGAAIGIGGLDSASNMVAEFPISFLLYKTSAGETYEMRFQYYDSGGSLNTLDFNNTILVDTVYTFRVRLNRISTGNDQLEIYLNGTTQNTGGDLGEELTTVNAAYLMLGATSVASGNYNMSYQFNNVQIKSGTAPGDCTE